MSNIKRSEDFEWAVQFLKEIAGDKEITVVLDNEFTPSEYQGRLVRIELAKGE